MNERTTLRQLPLAVRLVLTCFLFSVGLGYFSALVQLHLQHGSRDGNPLPTSTDVIERFSGVKKYDPAAPPPVSKIESLISGPKDAHWGKLNMTPAFFEKSGGAYKKACDERGKETVDAERDGERRAMITWLKIDPATRKKAYDDDVLPYSLPAAGPTLTEEFYDKDKHAVLIRTLIDTRCGKCHAGEQKPDLDEYDKLLPLMTPPSQEVLPGGWVTSSRQMSIEGLTQSTHAHLLSFSMLFTLTGLTFAFSSYPGWVRAVIGMSALLAQVADISCWWLARLPGSGPFFAQAIIVTGATVAVGLGLQIILSVFNMYGWKGKGVIVALFTAAGLGFGVLYTQVIGPNLEREKQSVRQG